MVARQLTAATHFPGQFPARQTGTGEQCSPLQEFFDSLRGCFTSPKKKDRSCKAFFGFTTSVFCFKLIVVNKKTQKQKQHIEILEKSQQLKFRMPTEIRISKHNALYQTSIQLEGLDYTKLYRAYSGIRKSQIEPRVLFKVLVCAYMKGVYSSRKIEELCSDRIISCKPPARGGLLHYTLKCGCYTTFLSVQGIHPPPLAAVLGLFAPDARAELDALPQCAVGTHGGALRLFGLLVQRNKCIFQNQPFPSFVSLRRASVSLHAP